MERLRYLGVLAGCLLAAIWLEPVLRVGVLRRWRRLLLTVLPVLAAFVAWDIAAIRAGHWDYDSGQTLGVTLPGRLPLEEALFFVVVPLCAILGFEAVRTTLVRTTLVRTTLVRTTLARAMLARTTLVRAMLARRRRGRFAGGGAGDRDRGSGR